MIKNLWTTLKRNNLSFTLNIVGLSVAFTVLTVVAIQVYYEFSYNRSFKDAKQIYALEYFDNVAGRYASNINMSVIEEFGENIPGIDTYCAISWLNEKKITTTDLQGIQHEYTEPFQWITPSFFEIFSPEIMAGDPRTALNGSYSVAIPESMARKFFGNEPALGKAISIGQASWTVTLVYKDFPKNSSVGNSIFVKLNDNSRENGSYYSYFKLNEQTKPEQVTGIMNKQDLPGVSQQALQSIREACVFDLLPLKDLYFKSKSTVNTIAAKGNLSTTLSLMAIALLITGIAYVNFINFSTALAPLRIKRINTQKVMGATTKHLRTVIISEAAFISLLAFGLSILWTWLFTTSPASVFFTANLALSANLPILCIFGCLALILGVIAGIYPAFYMTSFQPAVVLKGSFALTPKGIYLRNSLLLFQFITTIILITVAAFIKIQHGYMQNLDPGFDRENIVYIQADQKLRQQMNAFTHELKTKPEVLDHTLSGFLPGDSEMSWGRHFDEKAVQFAAWAVSHNFLRFFNIKMAEGTDFFAHNERGANKVIFNKKFIEKFEIKDAIGKQINCFNNMADVVGVAENINFNSTRNAVEPMAFVCGDDQRINYILIKISGVQVPGTIGFIRKTYQKFSDGPADVNFLDEHLNALYKQEENLAKLITIFGTITIVISLMGIYGLILFNARFKAKEIGIRKVNGATEQQMLVMLNKGFLKLIGVAFIVAAPVAWLVVKQWLESFANKTPVYWWVFILAGVLTLFITLLTVSHQSWKASTLNPVNTLKNE